jgi:hypothetical protein
MTEFLTNEYLKEISFQSNWLSDEGCLILNKIFQKSKIEIINLECKYCV